VVMVSMISGNVFEFVVICRVFFILVTWVVVGLFMDVI